jgi:putative DNA primase/helicase
MANLKTFFEFPVVVENKDTKHKSSLSIPPIGNYLRFDQFAHRILWGRPAPWYKASPEWSDEDAIEFKHILSEQLALEFPIELIHEVASVCANRRAFHPVRDYLESCQWDGIARVDTWLSRYCGALDTEYSRYIGRKTLVAAVARVFSPGCKFDHVLTTEGAQGIGKSYMWEILASPWFSDAPLHIQDKSAIEIMRGKWVIELAEMDALSKYESQTIKGFLSRCEDRCRLAYERKAKNFPRQNIFVGSINPELTGWLKDRTGNRRYWPITVANISLKGLKKDKDVLWAEALKIFQQGEILFVEDSKMQALMNAEVNSRMQEDPWFGLLEEHLHSNAGDYVEGANLVVMPVDLYTRCIGGNAATFRLQEANRIASILKILGFTKTKSTCKLGYVYLKEYTEVV